MRASQISLVRIRSAVEMMETEKRENEEEENVVLMPLKVSVSSEGLTQSESITGYTRGAGPICLIKHITSTVCTI